VSDDWDDIADWWVAATADGAADSDEMLDVLRALVSSVGGRTLDLGCGDGQALALLGDRAIGVDLSHRLLLAAAEHAPVVRCRLPDLAWIRPGSFDQAVAVGLLDLIADDQEFFEQVASAVRPDGVLVVVMNHPVVTSPDSQALIDADGQVVWRWGHYLERGELTQPAGHRTVKLHHRPVGELLTNAASAGWLLEQVIEVGATAHTITTSQDERGQEHLPSVLGARWRHR
jgi:SAM-dependent methyltransferase